MKAGIIAAGRGERLARGGISVPKPLVPIGGEPLIARAIRVAAHLKVSSIACIVNDIDPAVGDYLRSNSWPVPLELVVKTTPSSMESLFSLAPLLDDGPFLLFTVDAVSGLETLKGYVAEVQALRDAQGVLALTRYVDDERPLWVRTDSQRRITTVGDAARPSDHVTAGFYYFSPEIFAMMDAARAVKLSALRQFLDLLVRKGYRLYGVEVSKTLDVDYPEDIEKAEAYLKEVENGCGP